MARTLSITCLLILISALVAAAEYPYVTTWSVNIGTPEEDIAADFHVDSWGNAFIAGTTKGEFDTEKTYGGKDLFLARVDDRGIVSWIRQYGSVANDNVQGMNYSNEDVTVRGIGVQIEDIDEEYYHKNIFETALSVEYGGEVHSSTIPDKNYSYRRYKREDERDSIERYLVPGYYHEIDSIKAGNYTYEVGGIVGGECSDNDTMNGYLRISDNRSAEYVYFCTNGRDESKIVALMWGTPLVAGETEGHLNGQAGYGETDVFLYSPLFDTVLIGSEFDDEVKDLYVSRGGDIYVLGNTRGGLGKYVNIGESDVFLAKLDSDGELLWVRQFGSLEADSAVGLLPGNDGSIYLLCNTEEALEDSVNIGMTDAVLMRLDPEKSADSFVDLGKPSNDEDTDDSVIYLDGNDNAGMIDALCGDLICVKLKRELGEPDFVVLKHDSRIVRPVFGPNDETMDGYAYFWFEVEDPGKTVLKIGTEFYEVFSCKLTVEEPRPEAGYPPAAATYGNITSSHTRMELLEAF